MENNNTNIPNLPSTEETVTVSFYVSIKHVPESKVEEVRTNLNYCLTEQMTQSGISGVKIILNWY